MQFSADSIFQTEPYLNAYRKYFGRGKSWHTIETEGGAQAHLMSRGRTARRLEWWSAGIHDVGGAKYFDEESAHELWRRIHELSCSHHASHLAQIEAGSPFIEWARRDGWQVQEAEMCPVLTLPATWDEYVRGLGKNMREQIKRYPKRLEKQFAVETHLAQTPDEVRIALDDLFRLHGKRWRARGQSGVLATPRRQKFHREVCEEFLARDWLRLWSLKVDGRAACVLLAYVYQGRYSFFIGGFEPELMRWSVGTCLFAKVLSGAIAEGATEFDFLRGEEDYKYRLGAQNRRYQTLTRFADSPRGRLLKRRIALESTLMHEIHRRFGAGKAKEAKIQAPAEETSTA